MFRWLLYDLLRVYVRFGLKFYFNRIQVRNEKTLPDRVPLFFAANHQNSFLDAILIAATQRRRLYFLVRSDVFKNSAVRWLLNALNMMPVYRVRDGWSSIKNNVTTFGTTAQLLKDGSAVLIFPEGNHNLQRRLRPLSRGFTKPIRQAIEAAPDLPVHVVPVGLNYSAHLNFRSSVSVLYGSPISVQEFCNCGQLDANQLRNKLADEMRLLITHIDDQSDYDEIIKKLETCNPDFLDPYSVNKLITSNEWTAVEKAPVRPGFIQGISRFIHFIPLLGWSALREKIKDPVFTASIRFVYGIFVFPLYYFLAFIFMNFFVSWYYALIIVLLFVLSSRWMSRDH
jgi:1-acyl-sn-glycerol-3-phosphate acyltransferase